jgi:formylglycine-generating enzyme required for sulfatase activity
VIAYYSGLTDSSVAVANYTFPDAAPVFSPGAGTYTTAQTVIISTTMTGASIRYTTDGSTPSESAGTVYSGPVSTNVSLGATETLKAIAYESGWVDSPVGAAAYTITGTVATPTFSPGAGTYTTTQTVTISSTTPGALITYTTDGSTPVASGGSVSPVTVTVSASETVEAIAYKSTWTNSTVASAAYVITGTVSLAAQSGTITSGIAGSATFTATTTNIAAGTSGTVAWYSDYAGTIPTTAPTVITPSVTSVASNASTVTMTASFAMAGSYYFTVTFGSATSSVATLTVVDLTSPNIGILKAVPGGSFYNGTANMTVSSFHLGKYDITRKQFKDVMGTDPSTTVYSTGPSDPVQMVNWYQAIAFCNKLSLLEGKTPVYSVSGVSDWSTLAFASIPTSDDQYWNTATATWTNNGYRLPTEMEYMWAAIGGASDTRSGDIVGGVNTGGYTKGYAGSQEALGAVVNVYTYAWYTISSNKTHPVGTKTGNELGLYDMSGNVWQWCWDWYGSYPGATTDYRGASSGARRVTRGGSWACSSSYLASAYRSNFNSPNSQSSDFGFRVLAP